MYVLFQERDRISDKKERIAWKAKNIDLWALQ
jgi:hypothetical protein